MWRRSPLEGCVGYEPGYAVGHEFPYVLQPYEWQQWKINCMLPGKEPESHVSIKTFDGTRDFLQSVSSPGLPVSARFRLKSWKLSRKAFRKRWTWIPRRMFPRFAPWSARRSAPGEPPAATDGDRQEVNSAAKTVRFGSVLWWTGESGVQEGRDCRRFESEEEPR